MEPSSSSTRKSVPPALRRRVLPASGVSFKASATTGSSAGLRGHNGRVGDLEPMRNRWHAQSGCFGERGQHRSNPDSCGITRVAEQFVDLRTKPRPGQQFLPQLQKVGRASPDVEEDLVRQRIPH